MAHHHHHDHKHGHGHSHSHDHASPSGNAFALSIGLNLAFVVVEAGYGFVSGALSLVADAAHNLSDVLGLCLAWGATMLARRKPSRRRTYGLRRSTILAALANALLLLFAVGAVSWEAIGRLRDPQPVAGKTMLVVAAVGVALNGLSALPFLRSKDNDANIRGAFLHLIADAAVSLGVVIAGVAILKTGWNWIDPAVSILVSVFILVSTWSLLRESLDLALDAVPGHIDPEKVHGYLSQLAGVEHVHDLHIWAMSTTEVALTAHLVMREGPSTPAFLAEVGEALREKFKIEHSTLQVEPLGAHEACRPCVEVPVS